MKVSNMKYEIMKPYWSNVVKKMVKDCDVEVLYPVI